MAQRKPRRQHWRFSQRMAGQSAAAERRGLAALDSDGAGGGDYRVVAALVEVSLQNRATNYGRVTLLLRLKRNRRPAVFLG